MHVVILKYNTRSSSKKIILSQVAVNQLSRLQSIIVEKQGNRKYQNLSQVRCCLWWISLSICQGDKSMLLLINSLWQRLFLGNMRKRDIIHKTGSTQRITTST